MILERYTKQPRDVQDYDIDFGEYLDAYSDVGTSALTSVDKVTPDPLDPGLNIGQTQVIGGRVVRVWTSGGTSGRSYVVTVQLTTAAGRVKEAEILVKVKETP